MTKHIELKAGDKAVITRASGETEVIEAEKVWPSEGDGVHTITGHGVIRYWIYECATKNVLDHHVVQGNGFRTKEEAEHKRDRNEALTTLKRVIAEENEKAGWVCDWGDLLQRKGRFYFRAKSKTLECVAVLDVMSVETALHFKPELKDKIIERVGESTIMFAITGDKV